MTISVLRRARMYRRHENVIRSRNRTHCMPGHHQAAVARQRKRHVDEAWPPQEVPELLAWVLRRFDPDETAASPSLRQT